MFRSELALLVLSYLTIQFRHGTDGVYRFRQRNYRKCRSVEKKYLTGFVTLHRDIPRVHRCCFPTAVGRLRDRFFERLVHILEIEASVILMNLGRLPLGFDVHFRDIRLSLHNSVLYLRDSSVDRDGIQVPSETDVSGQNRFFGAKVHRPEVVDVLNASS